MEYGTWLRERAKLEKIATRNPDPDRRTEAGKRIRELDENYDRNK
jgi:hypothetical protein